ncbi:MAG: molybdenum cofactor biosynthesis protein MoaE [Bacteroidetes bacterium]|nr:molybdenum cofactor biosynthesis protein MoaE [Bacteroidota bacterium]
MEPFWIDIAEELPSIVEVYSFLNASQGGAVCVFSGITRLETNGRTTETLSYDAHKTMALKEMKRLAEVASSKWPVLRLVMLHRTGSVRVGEASVYIGVATAHRGPSFEASEFLIDELKKSVQIWKKEGFQDGTSEWVSTTWSDEKKTD